MTSCILRSWSMLKTTRPMLYHQQHNASKCRGVFEFVYESHVYYLERGRTRRRPCSLRWLNLVFVWRQS